MAYQRVDCASWDKLLEEIMRVMQQFESKYSASGVPFFRGHSSPNYHLLPGFFRPTETGLLYADYDEKNFYYEFRARAGALLNTSLTSWDVLFLMQHHGVPTRLLDWTESFATALYFALDGSTSDADVWMLDPYALNRQESNTKGIVDVESHFKAEYFDLFIEPGGRVNKPPGTAVAIYPRRQIARLASQHGLFTLHLTSAALESLEQPWLTRFRLSAPAVAETSRFLRVMGVNDFSLFPDLDGLSRFLRKRIKGGYGIVE
jgi:FRG domain